jgi:hypothetical protein
MRFIRQSSIRLPKGPRSPCGKSETRAREMNENPRQG